MAFLTLSVRGTSVPVWGVLPVKGNSICKVPLWTKVTGLVGLGRHVWGIFAVWLLISGHLFAFCFILSVVSRCRSLGSFGYFGLSAQTSVTNCSS